MLNPFDAPACDALAAAGLTSFALEAAPRTTRAQSMDVLSSQANIAGYKAVMIAADTYQRFLPMLMTAAGTVKAARVVILGVGVAGLQAIATAKRLGAVIEASRRAAERQGAGRVAGRASSSTCPTRPTRRRKPPKASAATPGRCRRAGSRARRSRSPSASALADVVITTALIPGRAAPMLITEEMVKAMKPGSVIVDLAAGKGRRRAATAR